MTKAQTACFARGSEDRHHGLGLHRNPYRAPWARRAWQAGWADANRLFKRQLRLV